MAFLQMETGYNPFTRVRLFPLGEPVSNQSTGVVAIAAVPATTPANPVGGSSIPGVQIQHVKITLPTTVAGMLIQFPHGLGYGGDVWAPTMVWAIMEQAEGSTPAAFYNVVWSKVTNQTISMQFSVTGVWHIFYA